MLTFCCAFAVYGIMVPRAPRVEGLGQLRQIKRASVLKFKGHGTLNPKPQLQEEEIYSTIQKGRRNVPHALIIILFRLEGA